MTDPVFAALIDFVCHTLVAKVKYVSLAPGLAHGNTQGIYASTSAGPMQRFCGQGVYIII